MSILVTGGAGFIGSNFVFDWLRQSDESVVNLDKLTFHLLEESRAYWLNLKDDEKKAFRFLHVSTDEVYGSLEPHDAPFRESIPYAPNSSYAASKSASDHFVRAYYHTYGLPTLTTIFVIG